MGGIHEADSALAGLGLGEPGLQTVFLHASGASTAALAGSIPTCARLPPQRVQELPHLRGFTHHPGQGLNRWRPLLKRGLDRRTVAVQSAARLTRREVFERLDAPGHRGVEGAMEARFRMPHSRRMSPLATV